MKLSKLLLLISALLYMACNKQTTAPNVEDCPIIRNVPRLTEEERANACIYQDVFEYEGKLYTVCECCVCDKAYQAIDCDGNDLFQNNPQSIPDFNRNAVYLFSIDGF